MKQRTFNFITRDDERYSAVCAMVANVFKDSFSANVTRNPEAALTIEERGEGGPSTITAATMLTGGLNKPFFSEIYLDEKIESILSRKFGEKIERFEIVEVGGLAAHGEIRAGQSLIAETPWFLLGMGYRYALVTATVQVRALFVRQGIDFHPLAPALLSRLPEDKRAIWGTYYENEPVTGVLDLFRSHLNIIIKRRRLALQTPRGTQTHSIQLKQTIRQASA